MAFCQKCGTQLQDDVNFCPNCEAQTGAAPEQPRTQQTAMPHNDEVENRGMAIIAYIGFLFIVPLLAGAHKTSPFVKYHTNQGIILFFYEMVVGFAFACACTIVAATDLHELSFLLLSCSVLVCFILAYLTILGMYHVMTGKTEPLPIVGTRQR